VVVFEREFWGIYIRSIQYKLEWVPSQHFIMEYHERKQFMGLMTTKINVGCVRI